MKCRVCNRHSANRYGVQFGHRSYNAGTSYKNINFLNNGFCLAQFKLICNRSPRRFSYHTKAEERAIIIYQNDDAINLVRQAVAILFPRIAEGNNIMRVFGETVVGIGFKTKRTKEGMRFLVRLLTKIGY